MRCNRCGANLADDAKFCNLCGGSVGGNSTNKSNKVKRGNDGFTDIFSPPVNSAFNPNYTDDTSGASQNNNFNSTTNFNVNSTGMSNNNFGNSVNLNNGNSSQDSSTDGNNNFNSTSNVKKHDNGGFKDVFSAPTDSSMNYNNQNNSNSNSFNSSNFNSGVNQSYNNDSNRNMNQGYNSNFNGNMSQSYNNGSNTNVNHDYNDGSNRNTNQGYNNNFNNNMNQNYNNNFNGNMSQEYNNNFNGNMNSNYNNGNNVMNFSYNNSGNGGKKSINFKILVPVMVVCLVAVVYFATDGFAFLSGKRTIMIYMIGSDLESKYAAASLDIHEIGNSGADFDKVNLLIYTGGSEKWQNENVQDDKNAIFKVNKDGSLKRLELFEKVSMTDPNTLASFLEYGYNNYKASKYSLILWDHGGGPIYGYGLDQNFVGSLTIPKLKQAFESSPFKNKKLEMIGFDACLMSSVEVASLLSNYANYMVASQEVEPGYGWDYKFLGDLKTSTSSVDFGMSIINYFENFYSKSYKTKGVTLSLLDLSKVSDVEDAIDNLFKDVDSNLTIDYSNVSRTRNQAKSFGRVSTNSLYDLVDLYDLINKLPSNYSEKAAKVKDVLNTFIVYQKTDLADTYGVSIYFPFENKNNIDSLLSLYRQFDFASEYTDFITNFSSTLTGNRMNNWKLSGNVPAISDDTISVTVPEEVVKNYSSASYVIFEKISDKYYMPRFKGTDITVSNNVFSTTIEKKGIVAYDSDETVYLTAFESEKGKDYVKYLIPAILQNWGSKMSENFTNEAVYVEFVIDNDNPKGVITGAIPILDEKDEDLVAPKLSLELKDWKMVQFWNMSYKIFDDNGNYTTEWESSGTMSGVEFKIADGFELEFRDLDSSKEYYALFHIYDSQGNRYTTNMVKVNV